jgi:hypothetical protein
MEKKSYVKKPERKVEVNSPKKDLRRKAPHIGL